MSSDNSIRKKRSISDSTPAPDGDHRKRRRNRTTQSCLNCHTSKRMCDRKRPACARCTQLGLTGLCVYEVDDPSQRTETQDESSRLLKRVAELEGVIRELKNKPHPRWVQAANTGEEFEKLDPHHRAGSDEPSSSSSPSPPLSSSSSDQGDPSPRRSMFTHPKTPPQSRHKSPYNTNSSINTPFPAVMTPTDEYPFSHVDIAGLSQEYDLTSMFLGYSGLMGVNDGSFPPLDDGHPSKQHGGHCGCLHDQSSYNTMLELSLRLRKASDALGQLPSHRMGETCHLHQRISELDSFTINALSDISTSPNVLVDPVHGVYQPQIYPHRLSATSRSCAVNANTTPWDMLAPNANPSASHDDLFMTWEPRRS